MPIYDYICTACGHRMEVIHGIYGHGPDACPVCGAVMRKGFVIPAIHFKGSGWAKKDRGAAASTRAAAKSAAGGDSTSPSDSSSSADSKVPSGSGGSSGSSGDGGSHGASGSHGDGGSSGSHRDGAAQSDTSTPKPATTTGSEAS